MDLPMRWIISSHRNHLCVTADVTECALVRQRQHLGTPPFPKGSRWNAPKSPKAVAPVPTKLAPKTVNKHHSIQNAASF